MRGVGPKRWLPPLAVVVLTMVLIASSGCSGYQRFTLREGDANFTFTYPREYENTLTDTSLGWPWVTFNRSLLEEGWVDSSIVVNASELGHLRGHTSARATINDFIITVFKEAHELRVISRSPVTVSGVEGEQIVCAYIQFPSYYDHIKGEGDVKEKTPAIFRKVAFENDGMIWEIGMMSIEEVAEADEEIFNHILETFRILD